MNDRSLLDFAKARMEEGEGISSDTLARILDMSAQPRKKTGLHTGRLWPTLLAASLAVAVCGWLLTGDDAIRRENNVSNVIELLRVADGGRPTSGHSLTENLIACQDAPAELDTED